MERAKKAASLTLAAVVVAAAMLGGCSKSGGDGNSKASESEAPVASSQPVTLTFYAMPAINQQKIKTLIVDPVQKKFPNITIDIMDNSQINQDTAFDKMVTANTIPDFMLINYNTIRILKTKGIGMDLSPLIKSNKVDLTKFTPRAIEYLKLYSDQSEMYGLPFFINVNAFSYNKAIFDKFAVSYPQDGMTWDQVINLAKKVTRSSDGVDYLGLNPSRPYVVAPQLSQDVIDPKTQKAAVNTDGWKQVLQMFQDIYNIPGNAPKDVNDFWGAQKSFYVNQNQAMNLLWWDTTMAGLQGAVDSGKPMNWDMVTAPAFPQNPKLAQWLDQFDMTVSAQSKHQKEAFQVIQYLTSSEYQTDLSKNGYITSLNDQGIKDQMGVNVPFLKGKNVQALFKMDYSKPLTPTKFSVNAIIDPFYKGIAYDKTDINTTLRDMEEKLNQAIQDNK